MNLLIVFFSGLLTAFIGALPPGTVNLAVLYASSNNQVKEAKKISYYAGFTEIAIATIAIFYSIQVVNFVKENPYFQYATILLLLVVGTYLLTQKSKKETKVRNITPSTGIILGLINPSVWVYWVIAISILEMYIIPFHFSTISIFYLFSFMIAVYTGKVIALQLFGKFGIFLNKSNKNNYLKQTIGFVCILLSFIQILS